MVVAKKTTPIDLVRVPVLARNYRILWVVSPACYLVGITYSLSAHDLRHSIKPCMQNMTSDMIGRSRGIDVLFSQLQCHYWTEGLPENAFLPSLSLTFKNLKFVLNRWTSLSSLSPVVPWPKNLAHPLWPWGLLAGFPGRIEFIWPVSSPGPPISHFCFGKSWLSWEVRVTVLTVLNWIGVKYRQVDKPKFQQKVTQKGPQCQLAGTVSTWGFTYVYTHGHIGHHCFKSAWNISNNQIKYTKSQRTESLRTQKSSTATQILRFSNGEVNISWQEGIDN